MHHAITELGLSFEAGEHALAQGSLITRWKRVAGVEDRSRLGVGKRLGHDVTRKCNVPAGPGRDLAEMRSDGEASPGAPPARFSCPGNRPHAMRGYAGARLGHRYLPASGTMNVRPAASRVLLKCLDTDHRRQRAQGQPNVAATSISAGYAADQAVLPTVARRGFARAKFCQALAHRLAEGRPAHVALDFVEADFRRVDPTCEDDIKHRHVPGIGDRELRLLRRRRSPAHRAE